MDQFAKIRTATAQGLPVPSKDVRALLEAYDRLKAALEALLDRPQPAGTPMPSRYKGY